MMWRISSNGGDPGEPDWVTERERFVPAALDWQVVLVETADVVCYLDDVRVYPSGFRFQVHARLKPAAAGWARTVFTARRARGEPGAAGADEFEGSFLFGVEYEDGRRAAVGIGSHGRPPFVEEPGEFPVLRLERSSAVPDASDSEAVLYGLPQKGSLTFHARWSALGAAESSVELDGDALRDAATRAVPLWPAVEPS
jgi:hypothetical protein